MLLLFMCLVGSKSPAFSIELVQSISELPRNGRLVKIKGYKEMDLVCGTEPSLVIPTYEGEPEELLKPLAGRMISFQSTDETFLFVFEGLARMGGVSLGFHSHYEFENGTLRSFTKNGGRCDESANYSLTMEYQCDNTTPKNTVRVLSFFRESKCQAKGVVKTSLLCAHIDMSSEVILPVKCIEKGLYDEAKRSML